MKNPIVKPTPSVLLAIPKDVIEEADINQGDLIQFSVTEGTIIIERIDDISDYDCDGDCDTCPVDQTDCDNDCDNCPCQERCPYSYRNREVN